MSTPDYIKSWYATVVETDEDFPDTTMLLEDLADYLKSFDNEQIKEVRIHLMADKEFKNLPENDI